MSKEISLTKKSRRLKLDSTQIIALGFIALIFLGGTILSLPISSRNGEATNFLSSLYTATSASCVTGLVVVDTFAHWNFFGQLIIILLIQIGGLGFMLLATLFSLILRRSISFKEALHVAQSLSLFDLKDIMRVIKHILLGTLAFESAGAFILSIRFIPDFGFVNGIWTGVFTSISSFCNAGFDLMGQNQLFSSLTGYASDLTVNVTVMLLIIIGGLGFFVWEELFTLRKFSQYSMFTKVVVVTTAILISVGALLIFIFEYGNPETFGQLPLKGKILASFFQSVTPRTAGFNTISLNDMREVSKLLIMFLMFIGASSGSTGGGVKVSTIAVLAAELIATIRGKKDVTLFRRKVSSDNVFRAFALVLLAILLLIVASFSISLIEGDIPYIAVLYECISAFATVGLSLGITSTLSPLSLIILICLMYLGRVGLLTVTYAIFFKQQRYTNKLQYPEGRIMIG